MAPKVLRLSSPDMHCTTAVFKKVLNVFVPNQTRRNTLASRRSSPPFHNDEQEKVDLGVQYMMPVESRLSILGHSNHYESDSDMTSELDDDDSEEDAEPSSATDPIVFSEDPIICSNEMVELADVLVDVAMTDIAESEEIMDASHIEDLSWWKKRLDLTSETMEILETDAPAVRLLKARTYLSAAGAFLRRVIFVVEHAKSLDVQPGNFESTPEQT